MSEPIILGLIQNIAILMAFAMLYENFWLRNDKPRGLLSKIFTGIVVGIISIVLMFTPWTMMPGIVFDTRSVMLAVSGVFFGGLPTVIAMAIAAAVRFFIGGDGTWMGIAVIITSGTIGIFWLQITGKQKWQKPLNFLLLGLVVHLIMMADTVFLPSDRMLTTLQTIVIPVFLIYTPGTMLLGMLLEA